MTMKPESTGQNPTRIIKRKKNPEKPTSPILNSSSVINFPIIFNNNNNNNNKGIKIPIKKRFNLRKNYYYSDVEAIAFPLGMSIAAVFAQVLERKDLTSDSTSADYLSMICASAVRESLTNVFGQKFDAFTANFEKSFGSTLSTIRLIRDTENDNREQLVENHNVTTIRSPDRIPAVDGARVECLGSNDITECCTKPVNHDCANSQYMESNGDVDDHVAIESKDQELSTQGLVSWQLASSNQGCLNNSVISTIEKSVSEQTRANELKSLEIGLIMKKLQLKETQLALNSDSIVLERCKLSLGISRTSFKVEKFKTQLEETKYGELLKTCADYLVTGLIIMCCCLSCGVYAFSYDNLRQLTKSCQPPEGSSSWWRPMASFNTGWQTLSCQVQVYSRIIFGGLMIGAIGLALVQRSDIARQGMPITFIVLLLAVLCGMVGKVCVDTLGGDGYTWLVLWEALCTIHFFATIFNQSLHRILYGAVQVSEEMKSRSVFPFRVRRWLFYLFLIALPVCCGLLPFASASTWWEDHISVLIRNRWSAAFSEPFDAEMRK